MLSSLSLATPQLSRKNSLRSSYSSPLASRGSLTDSLRSSCSPSPALCRRSTWKGAESPCLHRSASNFTYMSIEKKTLSNSCFSNWQKLADCQLVNDQMQMPYNMRSRFFLANSLKLCIVYFVNEALEQNMKTIFPAD